MGRTVAAGAVLAGTGVLPRDLRGLRGRGRRVAAVIALILGLAGFVVSAIGVTIQLLPRHFSASEQRQIEAWEVMRRWQTMPAGQIFPASVPYQLPAKVLKDVAPLDLNALRVSIAPQESDCAKAVTSATVGAALRRNGCEAVLRATYVDATRSYVMTVGVAVLPNAAAAASADSGLASPRLTAAHEASAAGRLPAGVQVVSFGGAAAGVYDYHRQISKSFTAGPYLIMYAVGYADSRPRVPVTDDPYSDAEMTSMAAWRRPFRRAHARRRSRPAPLPGGARMLTNRWRPRIALLAVAGLVSLAALPAAPALDAAAAPADGIQAKQQWVLSMLNAEAAWSVTRGAGVTVAVIDSGVNPDVSDLSGSVITGPDYTGVTTSPSSKNWGVHGTWMASLIAGHGHDGGLSGVIGTAPAARILSIRVIPDRADPHYGKYERERETVIQQSLADGIKYAVTHGAQGHQHVDRLQRAERHGQVGTAGRLRPRCGGDRLRRELGRPELEPGRQGPRVLPRGLPGRDQRQRRQSQRRGGRLLQRQPLRQGGGARGIGARPGPGRAVLAGQRHQPGLRAGGGGRRPDQVEVPATRA